MKKALISLTLAALVFTIPSRSFAWGAKGHGLVAEIAYHFLDDSTKSLVRNYISNMSIEEMSTWMDENRSNSYYDYMRSWHYIDFEKNEKYTPSADKNLLTVLFSAIQELRKMESLKKKRIKEDILLVFHLVGDLHQPLHTGYGSDRGGNSVDVRAQNFSSNLHSAWDTQILETEGVTLEKCLQTYETFTPAEIDSFKRIQVLKWMYGSRAYLDQVYNFKDGYLDSAYINRAKEIIQRQLVIGGLRLAAILTDVFKTNYKGPLSMVGTGLMFYGFKPSNAKNIRLVDPC